MVAVRRHISDLSRVRKMKLRFSKQTILISIRLSLLTHVLFNVHVEAFLYHRGL